MNDPGNFEILKGSQYRSGRLAWGRSWARFCSAGLWWNDELLFQVRFERVFFSVRPIVLSLALATMFNSTTLSSSRLNVHRARPFGGSEQARAMSLASAAPSKMRVLAEAGECLRVSTESNPSSTSC